MGHSRHLKLDPTLYPPSAVQRATVAYADVVAVQHGSATSDWITVESTEPEGIDEFLNYLLLASLELHLANV